MTLRVAHVITGLETGGAEVLLARVAERLDPELARGPVISLTTRGPLAERIEAAGVDVVALGLSSAPGPAGWVRLRRALAATQAEVFQTWLLHANVLGGLAAKSLRGSGLVWGVHMSAAEPGTHGRSTIALQRAERALSARVPDHVIACSATALGEMRARGYAPGKLELVPNGFDTTVFRPDADDRATVRRELGIGEKTPLVAHFARFHPMKDHANMIRAARRALERVPGAVFLLCGDGVDESNAELREMVGPDAGSIRLLGVRRDVARLLRAIDLGVLSSASGEALPLVIGETMASGAPFVATEVGDAAAIIGDCGAVVPPRRPEALGEAIASVLSLGEAERTKLGRRARERITGNYSLDAMIDGYVRAWERVASGRTA